jgi:hypothetical protein
MVVWFLAMICVVLPSDSRCASFVTHDMYAFHTSVRLKPATYCPTDTCTDAADKQTNV